MIMPPRWFNPGDTASQGSVLFPNQTDISGAIISYMYALKTQSLDAGLESGAGPYYLNGLEQFFNISVAQFLHL